MTTSSLSEKIIVMEITQLKHYRKEFAKVSKVIYQNYCKPGRSYNCKPWVAEGIGFLARQVSRLKLSTGCDERELKLEMLELDWQFPQSCTDVAGHVSQFLVALILSQSDSVQTFSRCRWEKQHFQLARSLTIFVTDGLWADNPCPRNQSKAQKSNNRGPVFANFRNAQFSEKKAKHALSHHSEFILVTAVICDK